MKRLFAGAAAAIVAATGVLAANVGTANATSADWAWPGQKFVVAIGGNSTKSCSVGYPGTDNAGNRYFITAGHCFRTSSGSHYERRDGTTLDVYDPANPGVSIGWERVYTIPSGGYYVDISVVQMRSGKKLTGYGWKQIPAVASTSRVGDTACAVGQNHERSTCGKVTEVGAEIQVKGYDWKKVVNTATYCTYPGDSGGAVYNDSGVLGIVSSAPTDTCHDSYVPISIALKAIRNSIPSFRLY
ncbi:trypsin-like serine protease [Tsukamurella tyrosinosolvens]|uniref:S1 family peptidase n=1 Tax=Tsukamurella asaccharolytica TaxID=2592067 RepID=A0A5C5R3G6_9ACTN|nr:trypsin-like serine protease [Tsukamurella tyrosinosolvens]TWS17777.1 S1 family peptidase [Tsukamurella asaccharolytica]